MFFTGIPCILGFIEPTHVPIFRAELIGTHVKHFIWPIKIKTIPRMLCEILWAPCISIIKGNWQREHNPNDATHRWFFVSPNLQPGQHNLNKQNGRLFSETQSIRHIVYFISNYYINTATTIANGDYYGYLILVNIIRIFTSYKIFSDIYTRVSTRQFL